VIYSRVVLTERRRGLRLGYVVFVRGRPIMGWWWLRILGGYRWRRWAFRIGHARWLAPAVVPAARRGWFTLLFFHDNGSSTRTFRPVERTRLRVRLTVATSRFTMRDVYLIATGAVRIGCSRVMHLLFCLQWGWWFGRSILRPRYFTCISFAHETATGTIIA
jgi:hypothetical protein